MAGKRQRGIRRTVSVSTMGPGSNMFESSPLPEYPKEKQKAPVLSSHSPHRMLASNNPVKPSLAHADAVSPAQPAAPLQPLPVSHKFEKPPSTLPSSGWDRSERKCVGLGVVAALADESGASTEVKDGKDKAPPPVVSQNTILPHSAQHPSHNMDMQGRSAIFLHESPCSNDYDDLVSMELPAVNFLEFCYLCKRQLCQGRDIYMYRGDQAFCSEECRYEQIVVDERKEKCSLQAIKMRTSTSPIQSRDQRSRRVTSGAAAAG